MLTSKFCSCVLIGTRLDCTNLLSTQYGLIFWINQKNIDIFYWIINVPGIPWTPLSFETCGSCFKTRRSKVLYYWLPAIIWCFIQMSNLPNIWKHQMVQNIGVCDFSSKHGKIWKIVGLSGQVAIFPNLVQLSFCSKYPNISP